MSGKLFGYARVSVASDANNLKRQRRVLTDSDRVFEDVVRGPSEFRV